MIKKILVYTFAAVLFGVVTTLAPYALFVSEMDTQAEPFFTSSTPENMRTMSSKTEQTQGITPATYPLDVLFIAFMLTLSLVIALGVMRRFMRKTVF